MGDEEDQLERLLGRGYLSGSRYDEIERRVLARTARPQGVLLRRVVPASIGVASLAAAAVLWLRAPSEFTAKGEVAGGVGVLDVSCNRPDRHQCGSGDTLAFIVNSGAAEGYLGAYAERVGDPSPERIWYFPGTREAGPKIVPAGGTLVLPEGIRIGPEHEAGQYLVTILLSKKPLTRAEIDHAKRSEFVVYSRVTTEVVP